MTDETRSDAVNRETKRMMERRNRGAALAATETEDGELGAEGFAELGDLGPVSPKKGGGAHRQKARQRTTPVRFAREIRDELRQVAWPTRAEMVNYSTVVLVTLVVMVALIFLLNLAFGKGVFFMFQK